MLFTTPINFALQQEFKVLDVNIFTQKRSQRKYVQTHCSMARWNSKLTFQHMGNTIDSISFDRGLNRGHKDSVSSLLQLRKRRTSRLVTLCAFLVHRNPDVKSGLICKTMVPTQSLYQWVYYRLSTGIWQRHPSKCYNQITPSKIFANEI